MKENIAKYNTQGFRRILFEESDFQNRFKYIFNTRYQITAEGFTATKYFPRFFYKQKEAH